MGLSPGGRNMGSNAGIVALKFVPVPGGKEIQAISQNARGTRYLAGSVVVLSSQKGSDDRRLEFASAVDQLVAKHSRNSVS